MSRIALTHVIEERFAAPVRLSTHWLRLRPAAHARAHVTAYSLRVRTAPHFVNWVRDAFENHVARVDFPEPVRRFAVEVDVIAEIADTDPFDFLLDERAVEHPFEYDPQVRRELGPYLRLEPAGPRLARWLARLPRGRLGIVDRVREIVAAVHEAVTVAATGRCDVETALVRGEGDSASLAWLAVSSLRALGLAARFTSGYRVLPAGDRVAATLHAWSEVFLPGAGWIGVDPAAGLFTTAAWVPLACAPDPTKARAVAGFREACELEESETLVARVLAPVAPAAPCSSGAWAQIAALGRQVDADLDAAGVRLAVGRELAFVSAEHAGCAEWRIAALGPSKLPVAQALLAALRDRLPPGGMVTIGDGEWFAGEPLPRWRLAYVWRTDGRPVWRDPARAGPAPAVRVPAGSAETFGRTLARTLGVPASSLVPAYEDPLCPLRADTEGAPEDLRDPDRRRALVDRLSEERAGVPVGWVLPLAWDHANDGWRSGAWTFRRRRLYLLAGTLPIGVRLPLASLPPDDAADADDPPRCPFAPRDALPDVHALPAAVQPPSPAPPPRTAVCIEVRDGHLHVFLPPLGRAEQHLLLVAAIEAAAEREGVAVVLEGYEPPEDPRLSRIVLEPAPGTLRVVLPATASVPEHAAVLDVAYAEAARLGLRAERILPDGTCEPVGARAPLVLGGTTPEASPFLRRPAILRALIVHWQRHPSLSYLFANGLVGPGGPAPRADEGRAAALADLAIALERIPGGEAYPPWLPDRVLRHVLADASGDGRRTELCVERLYDPAHASRRRGEVAIGSFGMPPCARTATLETLLVTALVARFTRHPSAATILPWGHALHDRFMLPSALSADLRAVLADLASAGYPFQPSWFVPCFDTQFPLLGRLQLGDVMLDLRTAHEPWPVLAEEATGGGMARFVDSANARVEVRLSGHAPRHVVVCNGRRVPLQPAGDEAAWIAGVRYKRWNPPATLRPTTAPVGALVFDVIDTWTGRAIGGCRYVPAVPELCGPVAVPQIGAPVWTEGEARRSVARVGPSPPGSGRGWFRAGGSGVGPMALPPEDLARGWTLDLTVPA